MREDAMAHACSTKQTQACALSHTVPIEMALREDVATRRENVIVASRAC
jgi:hypothetical protein